MSDHQAKFIWVNAVLDIDLPLPGTAPAEGGGEKRENLGDRLRGLKKAVTDGVSSVVDTVVSGVKAVKDTIVTAVTDAMVNKETAKFDTAMKRLDEEIKNVTAAGLDAGHYQAQAKDLRDQFEAAKKVAGNADRIVAVSTLAQLAKQQAAQAAADVQRLSHSAVEGVTAAVKGMRDGAKEAIDALAETVKEKPELAKRLGDLDKLIAETGKLTDRAAQAKKLKQVNVEAESLFRDAAKAGNDDAIVQKVYAKALKDRYGIEISNPAGMANTHLEQVYEMFDKVPEADVVQGRMKKLTYQPLDDKGEKNTGAAYGGAEIFMGDYGKETWTYLDPDNPGKEIKPNGFSISTLHELGHSVDDRFGVMRSNQGKKGAGGWNEENREKVAAALIKHFKAGDGKAIAMDAAALDDMAQKALSGAKTKRPDGMSDEDWAKQPKQDKPATLSAKDWKVIDKFLDYCVSRGSSEWPWGKVSDIDGRSYHEAYDNEWVSYDATSRSASNTVRDYQWRAPAEYFAELYAFTYMQSKPPPGGVDASLAAYMFGGKSASEGAPAKK